jgi:hypothetical protein
VIFSIPKIEKSKLFFATPTRPKAFDIWESTIALPGNRQGEYIKGIAGIILQNGTALRCGDWIFFRKFSGGKIKSVYSFA